MPRAVIYCRVSTTEQVKNLSLSTQQQSCIKYCESEGVNVAKIFVEEGESAKTSDRTKFKELLVYCRENKGRVSFVVVHSLTRFARDKYSHFAVRAYLSKLGITLRSATEPIDDSSSGKLMEGILAAFSQFDNDVRSERTVAGMKAAIEKGRWTFPAPLGYCRKPDQRGRSTLALDPATAPLVRQAFQLYASGAYKREQVLRIVTAAGLRTKRGKKLSAQSFCNMLRNPLYAGRIVVGQWQVDCPGAFEPLIKPEVFRQVEAILSGKRPTIMPRFKSHPDFPLRHFVACGSCRCPLTGSSSRGRTKRYAYYHCVNHSCKAPNIRKSEMEEKFLALIERLQPLPSYLRLFREIVLDVWKDRQTAANTIAAALSLRLRELEEKKQRVIEAFLHRHEIDKETYQNQLDRTREEIAVAELELHDAKLEEFDMDASLGFATSVLSNAARFWIECSHDQKERFQRILFPEGLIFEGDGFGTPATCLAFSYLREVALSNSSLASRTGVEPVSPP
jgi:site-specific DNA recombinase